MVNIVTVPMFETDDDEQDSFAAKTRTHVPRVLIIEDSIDLGQVIQKSLSKIHCLGLHETHGHEALHRYTQFNPDLVLLDISLPDMTGWEVLDAMKEQKATDTRPAIVVITAFGDPANRLMGRLQGVDAYLVKPFGADELQQVVQETLRRRPTRQ